MQEICEGGDEQTQSTESSVTALLHSASMDPMTALIAEIFTQLPSAVCKHRLHVTQNALLFYEPYPFFISSD